MNTKVSISILTYNRSTILNELLTSLASITDVLDDIIVVDNHSTDDTEAMVRQNHPHIRYYKTPSNIGVAARNLGISKAAGDIIITLDDDIIGIDDQDIKTLIRLFEEKMDVGAICFKIRDYQSDEICNWCHHYQTEVFADREFITDEITEGAVAFRKSAIQKSGLYPDFFFISYEGSDLLCRLLVAGYKTMYSPDIEVKHRTAQQGRPNWRRYYYDTRNQIWMVARNYPFLLGIKYLLRGLPAMFVYSFRDRFISFWFRAIYDGIRGLPKVLENRKPLGSESVKILKDIAKNRPGLLYTAKKRLIKREISL